MTPSGLLTLAALAIAQVSPRAPSSRTGTIRIASFNIQVFGRKVSDHFPVFAEFNITGPDDDGCRRAKREAGPFTGPSLRAGPLRAAPC